MLHRYSLLYYYYDDVKELRLQFDCLAPKLAPMHVIWKYAVFKAMPRVFRKTQTTAPLTEKNT